MNAPKKPIVVTITGIRPDFIRMSEVFKKLDESKYLDHIMIHTGQHYDKMLSDVFFEDLNIRKPDFNLECGGGSHYEQISKLTSKLLETLKSIKPDIVVYLGDSNSVLTAPSVRKEGFKVAHIEAGMRSGDMRMLEEINRKVCDTVSNIHFVYHENYAENIKKENISSDGVFVVGNTIVEPIKIALDNKKTYMYNVKNPLFTKQVLVDIHRPENFNNTQRLNKILNFLTAIQELYGYKIKILQFKRTFDAINNANLNHIIEKFDIIPLMSFYEYLGHCMNSMFVVSDSGTAQEELSLINKKVIVPRDFTERPESMSYNCSRLINMDNTRIWYKTINWAIDESNTDSSWLGNGNASDQIVSVLENYLLDETYYLKG